MIKFFHYRNVIPSTRDQRSYLPEKAQSAAAGGPLVRIQIVP